MESQAITFVDLDSSDEATVIVRRIPGGIGLGVSLKSDGDIETFMTIETAHELLRALSAVIDTSAS